MVSNFRRRKGACRLLSYGHDAAVGHTIRCLSERRIDFPRPPDTGRPRLLSRQSLVRRSFIPNFVAGITARRKVVSAGSRHIAVSIQRWKTAFRTVEQTGKANLRYPQKRLSLLGKSETAFSLSKRKRKGGVRYAPPAGGISRGRLFTKTCNY